jgi:hypothetical protein
LEKQGRGIKTTRSYKIPVFSGLRKGAVSWRVRWELSQRILLPTLLEPVLFTAVDKSARRQSLRITPRKYPGARDARKSVNGFVNGVRENPRYTAILRTPEAPENTKHDTPRNLVKYFQVLVLAREWRFKSSHPHQKTKELNGARKWADRYIWVTVIKIVAIAFFSMYFRRAVLCASAVVLD